MNYKDITSKLRRPTQYICAEISIQYRYHRNAGEVLNDKIKWWLKDMEKDGEDCDRDGYLKTPFITKRCCGSKDECQRKAQKERFQRHAYGTTSRAEQLGMWGTSWRVLPADENGNWIPSGAMIKKVLGELESSQN